MSELEAITARLAALEERLNMTEGLRASGDRDLSTLTMQARSTNNLIQAMAITQSDHGRVLTEAVERLTGLEKSNKGIVALIDVQAATLKTIMQMLTTLVEREG